FTQMGLKCQDLRLHTPKRDETYNFPIPFTVTSYYIKSKPHQLIKTLYFTIFWYLNILIFIQDLRTLGLETCFIRWFLAVKSSFFRETGFVYLNSQNLKSYKKIHKSHRLTVV
ncbi:hypothetical protein, partial [Planktothrix sp. FACHB-1355]